MNMTQDPEALLKHLTSKLFTKRVLLLPRFGNIRGDIIARWMHRNWMRAGVWTPFLHLDPIHGLSAIASSIPHTPDAWVYIGTTPQDTIPEQLSTLANTYRQWMLVQSNDTIQVDPEWERAIHNLDALHGVATDPDLEPVRNSLKAQCSHPSTIHLRGERGTGKVALTKWTHTNLDARPLIHFRGTQGQLQPGKWLLFEEVQSLGTDQFSVLEHILAAYSPSVRTTTLRSSSHTRPTHPALEPIIGKSATIIETLERLLQLAPGTHPLLIQGEPGVGKELFARTAHTLSQRSGPFISLDLSSIPDARLEGELFGYVKDAFVGAHQAQEGVFRQARGGTLFLEHLSSIPYTLQTKILRALQEGHVRPIGSHSAYAFDTRLIISTNSDLSYAVRQGTFRADLLAHLDAAHIYIPPLRARKEDIESLACAFLTQHGRTLESPWCDPDVLQILHQYPWPGNVRELWNITRYALSVAPPRGLFKSYHLGPLSPDKHRKVPVFTTHSGSYEELQRLYIPPGQLQQMTLTTLHTPNFRDRSHVSRRQAILHALDGRPATPAALEALQNHPWWGNFDEIRSKMSTLRAQPHGLLNLDTLRAYLPEIVEHTNAQAHLKLLYTPRRDHQGQVNGLTWTFDKGALLIGRTSRILDIQNASIKGDQRAFDWLEHIQRHCQDIQPACVDFRFLHRLSRAHLLLLRSPDGITASILPHVHLEVWAGPLSSSTLTTLQTHTPLPLEDAAELRFVHPRKKEVYMQLFVFLGQAAYEHYAPYAVERLLPQSAPSSQPRPPSDNLTPPAPRRMPRAWMLNEEEGMVLTDLLLSAQEPNLSQHLARMLPGIFSRPSLERLLTFLHHTPALEDDIVNLYAFPGNEHLMDKLSSRLAMMNQRDMRVAFLPYELQKLLKDTP